MSAMNTNMSSFDLQTGSIEIPKPSADEIRPLAEELYVNTNCEPAHDVHNWKCAESILEQKRRVQIEIEKAARQGHF
jgi:hypothetical protein